MQRKLAHERCERLSGLDGLTLRRKCARFVLEHAEAIRSVQPKLPEGLNDRAADIWEPLLILAEQAGGEWPERARQAAASLSASAQEGEPIGSLLMDILELFVRSGRDRVFSKTLALWLDMSEERPWLVLKKGKRVTGQWVSQQLQPFGIRPKTMRIEQERAKGYELEDFRETFQRYIPASEVAGFKAELNEQVMKPKSAEEPAAEPTRREGEALG
jgi:hypothetical protein